MSRLMSLAEAVEMIRDGDTVAMEGFTHLIPHAAGHEIIRQRRKRLTLIRMTPDLIYDQLIGMGCAEKVVFSWGGNPGVGSLHRFRDAYENGWPNRSRSRSTRTPPWRTPMRRAPPVCLARSSAAIAAPTCRRSIRTSRPSPARSPARRSPPCPRIRPDVAVVHAQRADRAGNVMLEGIVGVQKEVVLASKRSIVTVEEIVDDFGPRSLNAVILPSWTVGAIAHVPGGAYPSYAQGYYKRDNAYYKAWDAISRDRDGFLAWMKTNVLEQGPEAFAAHVSKLRTAAE